MLAAITLSSVLGVWACSVKNDPRSMVTYTLQANGRGKYVKKYRLDPPRFFPPVVQTFTFEFFGGEHQAALVERIAEPGGGVLKAYHLVRFARNQMLDTETGYWRDDGEYASLPDKEHLGCTKRHE